MAFLTHTTKVANPNGRRHVKKSRKRKRTTRPNPSAIITLGAAALGNPYKPKFKSRTKRKGVKVMAKSRKKNSRRTRRRSNPVVKVRRRRRVAVAAPVRRRRRRSTARRANPVTRVVYRTRKRKSNGGKRNRRRNPSVFGTSVTSGAGVKMVFGGLAGVAITRALPNIVRRFIALPSGGWVNVLLAGVSAYASGMIGAKFLGPAVGDALMFGGLMETGSAALTMAGVTAVGQYPLTLKGYGGNGLGVFHPASFPIPQMPVMGAPGPVAGAAIAAGTPNVAGFRSAFGA